MFTTGSKLLFGAAALAAAMAALYGVCQDGTLGTISLVSAAVGLALLAGVNTFLRDSNVSAMDRDAFASAAAAQATARPSLWPLIAGLGAVTVTLGLVTYKAIFMLGVIALIAAALEWLAQNWSERVSAEPGFNSAARNSLIDPLELPVAGAAGAGIIVYAFSRVMLGLPSKDATVAGFAVAGALVLGVGALVGMGRKVSKTALTGLFSVAAVALVAGGAFAGLNGQREIEKHETTSDLAAADECGPDETHADLNASQSVASKSNPAAKVHYDGSALVANLPGFDADFATLTLPRANPSNILFYNDSSGPVRFVVELHPDPNAADPGPERLCTALVEDGGTELLTVRIPESSRVVEARGEGGYAITVAGTDTSIEVIVP